MDGHLFRNHSWREWGLGSIANDPNVSMAERMCFTRHSNPSSHIAYIRAGHNSNFAFQKAVSRAPMPKKKEIIQKNSAVTKISKATKKAAAAGQMRTKVICKFDPPIAPAYMKAPPQILESHANNRKKAPSSSDKQIPRGVATRAATAGAVRQSSRVQKTKIGNE